MGLYLTTEQVNAYDMLGDVLKDSKEANNETMLVLGALKLLLDTHTFPKILVMIDELANYDSAGACIVRLLDIHGLNEER